MIAADRAALDVSDRDAVLSAVCGSEPDAIVHAGAWTAVDACESDPDRAFAANGLGTRHVAEAARRTGAYLCYVSTDYVFDGAKTAPYLEWDATNPQTTYGQSKLAGELEIDPGQSIVRTSWVCGAHGHNFVKTMLRLAAERESWGVVDDQRGTPTFTFDLAPAIYRLVAGRLPGTFHLSNQGPTTWYEFAGAILEAAGHDRARITPITTVDYPTPAPRPANSVLDNAAWRLSGFDPLPDWRPSLGRLLKEIL